MLNSFITLLFIFSSSSFLEHSTIFSFFSFAASIPDSQATQKGSTLQLFSLLSYLFFLLFLQTKSVATRDLMNSDRKFWE